MSDPRYRKPHELITELEDEIKQRDECIKKLSEENEKYRRALAWYCHAYKLNVELPLIAIQHAQVSLGEGWRGQYDIVAENRTLSAKVKELGEDNKRWVEANKMWYEKLNAKAAKNKFLNTNLKQRDERIKELEEAIEQAVSDFAYIGGQQTGTTTDNPVLHRSWLATRNLQAVLSKIQKLKGGQA